MLAIGGAMGEVAEWRAHARYMEVVGEKRVSADWLELDGERLYLWDGRRRSRVEDVSAALTGLVKGLDEGEWLVVELDDVAPSVSGTEVLVAALDAGVEQVLLLPDGRGGPIEEPVWITLSEGFGGYLMGLTMDGSDTAGAGVMHRVGGAEESQEGTLEGALERASEGALVTEVWEPVNAKNSPEADLVQLRRRWQAEGHEELVQGLLGIGAGVPLSIWGGWLANLEAAGAPLQVVLLHK